VEGDIPLVWFPEDDANAAWLPVDAAALRELVERVLGPVLAYDSARGTELVRSLRVWLEQDRRTERAARSLRVHKHTLTYRLGRVQELTGKDLSRMEDVVNLWLALRAHEVIGSEGHA
jgi:purine catabolism regulator